MDFGDAFGTLADTEYTLDVGYVVAGFLGPALVKYGVEDKAGRDLPDEVYGGTVAFGGALYGGDVGRKVALGGGVHVIEQLRTRVSEGGN
ncbi:hypothetical protein [Halomicrobium urmianum]|uniref:hypothetical protein n=1 Tax=Halomicrobium urmianum TaxID=1586233 RepID=UPI001CD9C6CD|nr:hypothetical protein [Halomicrobium urmianum]